MKQLSQIIALSLFGLNALQIILAAGTVIMFLKITINKLSGGRRRWKIRKMNRDVERNMWAIE